MNEYFLSQLKGIPVISRLDEEVGRVADVVIIVGEIFPKVSGFQVRCSGGDRKILQWRHIRLISRRVVSLDVPVADIGWVEPQEHELLLEKEILDKQIVDMDGAKVVRVNDLKLAQLNGELYLVAADVGIRGLLRRLGVEGTAEWVLSVVRKGLPHTFISWNLVEPLGAGLARVKLTVPQRRIAQLHPADIAEIITQVAPPERHAIFDALDTETAAEALEAMEPELQLAILDNLTDTKARQIVEEMSPDDAADLLGDLPEDKARQLLEAIPQEDAEEIEELLEYHEHTAGGLMTTEYIAIPETLTAEETIQRLRDLSPEAETIYYLYVVDADGRLTGVISLRDLIVSPPARPVAEILQPKVVSVPIGATKEEVANLIHKYDLLAIPVLDEERKLAGIITVDDVLDVVMPARWKRRSTTPLR